MSDSSQEQPRSAVSEVSEAETPVETGATETDAVAAATVDAGNGAPAADAEAVAPTKADVETPTAEAADETPTAEAAGAETPPAEARDAATPAAEAADGTPPDETADAATPEAEAETPTAEPVEADAAAPDRTADDTSSLSPAVLALKERMDDNELVRGKVIGWNKGGFHVVCEGVTTFCPNSEMELGKVRAPKDYLDEEYEFAVLRIEDGGRRVVVSRSKQLEGQRAKKREVARQKIQPGTEIQGKVASLTDFGAFVDVGGAQGLVHVSEISRRRVEHPSEVLSVGQQVKVKVLKVEQGGKRISLSMKALEPDPWKGVAERFPEGSIVKGTVERTAKFGAFVSLEPGLTGLLPASVLNLPRDAQISRIYSPGKELTLMVMSVDPRRRRISLALEGSQTEGSRSDFESYKKGQGKAGSGFNALAAAFQKIRES